MKKIFFLMICLLISILPKILHAEEVYFYLDENEVTTTLWEVAIPENFEVAQVSPKDQLFIELIPEGEKIENWSEIISLIQTPFTNDDSFHAYFNWIKEYFDRYPSVLKSEVSYKFEKGIEIGTYIFDGPFNSPMTNFKISQTENQLVMMKVAKAVTDLWHVQYTIRYPKKISKKDKEHLVKKMQQFMNQCVVVQGKL